ncbi:hypothetical protein BGW42_005661 [Actinomortierella wolfii]|nr:hypothetical protein BGW42_005661 [Actinomortierella wolfii]
MNPESSLIPPPLPKRPSADSRPAEDDTTAPNMKTEVMLDNPGSLPVASANHRTSSPEQLPRATSQASVPSDANSSVQYDKESSPAVMSETSTSSPTAQRKMTNEEVAFQFDRHVQEIRRRRTRAKGPPRPDPEDFTTVEAESGKRILNVPHYIQAYLVYFVESLARDDRATRKPEPLQWSRIRALLSRLFDSSSPAQSFGLYVERVMYWENPPETIVWLMIYSFLWYNHLWLPGFLACFVFKMLNNRFRIIGNLHTVLNIPQSLNERIVEQQQQHRRTKMRSQLHQLIASRDLTDWLMTVMKIWGPYLQALAEENIGYIERFKNVQEKNEYHCMLRGKPGKLIIHEENIQFRSAKLLGRDIEAVIPWDMIDTIKKTKTMSIGLWSTAGIEVTDINGRQTTFQNVVHRDDAFRKLVLASGKRWASTV